VRGCLRYFFKIDWRCHGENGLTIDNPQLNLDLSILIVNWNTCDLLAKCLASVYAHPPSGSFEVIVVDNASADGSVDMVRERYPQVRLIANNENLTFARGNNQGILLALNKSKNIMLLNSDTEVFSGALDSLLEIFATESTAGAVGPMMLNPDMTTQSSYGSLPSIVGEIVGPYLLDELTKPWGRIGRHYTSINNNPKQVERVSFACIMIRSEIFAEVGLLDESFVFYSEDYDFFKRLEGTAWKVLFCPEAQVVHHWGGSSRKRSFWATRQLYRSKRLYFEKHYGVPIRKKLDAGLTVRFTSKLLLGKLFKWVTHRPVDEQQDLQQALLKDLRYEPSKILLS
jgi:N-acetylglucosaminyl-diphospho-decaprenol L-rhamnosyltransferase